MRQITQSVGSPLPAAFDYYAGGPIWRRTNGNGTIVYYTYDAKLRPTAISHRNVAGGVESEQQRLEYSYDNNGNVLTSKNAMIGGSTWNTAFTFDRANRLLTENRTGGVSFNFSNSYSYDKAGNRTSVVRDGVSSTYSVDNNDKLLTGDGFTFSGYSADGNPGTVVQAGYGAITFQYDYENRPTRIDYPGGYSTYRYNGDGQRVESFDSAGAVTKRFVYDGSTLVAETNGSNQITTFYLAGVGYNGSGGSQFYDRDNALGSSMATVNGSGIIQSVREYDSYGVAYQVQAGIQSAFRFAGKHGYFTDDATGLQLLGARYYMPKLGRFITQDPIGHEGGLNLYNYCENNPLTRVDPDGTQGNPTFDYFNRLLGRPTFENVKAGFGEVSKKLRPTESEGRVALSAIYLGLNFLSFIDPTPAADSLLAVGHYLGGDNTSAMQYGVAAGLPFVSGSLFKVSTSAVFRKGEWFAHFSKHAGEFPVGMTSVQYLRGAQELLAGGAGTWSHTRRNGDRLFYRPSTNEFGVRSANGYIKTYFKPKQGVSY